MNRHLMLSLVLALAAGLAATGCSRQGVKEPISSPTTPGAVSGPGTGGDKPGNGADPNGGNVEKDKGGKTVFIYPDVRFAYDDASLDADAKTTLKDIGEHLVVSATSRVTIEGHCDERGSVEYNQALGERRANSVKEYLKSYGVTDESRMQTLSYGNQRPIDPGHDETAWARNRRAHFVVANQ